MEKWVSILKPAEIAEKRLLEAILSGHFAINSSLPGERDLAEQIGVTRPTLREALQRLARDGWLDIQHGKATRVRDYWQEGNMGVLSTLARMPAQQTPEFVTYLLEVRILLAPTYTRQAMENAPQEIAALLAGYASIEETAQAYAHADWELHHLLTLLAKNPVFRLLMNSFQHLYEAVGVLYFDSQENRDRSRAYYEELLNCAEKNACATAESLARSVMEESLALWRKSYDG